MNWDEIFSAFFVLPETDDRAQLGTENNGLILRAMKCYSYSSGDGKLGVWKD